MLIFDDETDNTVGLGRVGQAGGGVEQGGKRSWRSFSLSSFSSSHSSILFLAKFLSLPHSSRFVLQRHFCHRHILPDLFLATFLSLPHSSRLFFCDGIFFIVAFLQAFFLQRHFCLRHIFAGFFSATAFLSSLHSCRLFNIWDQSGSRSAFWDKEESTKFQLKCWNDQPDLWVSFNISDYQLSNTNHQQSSWSPCFTSLGNLGDILESLEAMGYQGGEETQVLRYLSSKMLLHYQYCFCSNHYFAITSFTFKQPCQLSGLIPSKV